MSFIGKWAFYSAGMINDDDELVFYVGEELLKAPMPYVDESYPEAVKAGAIKLYDGMMTDAPKTWEERDGALWVDWGMGEMSQASDEDGDLVFMTYRFRKIEK